MNKQYITHCDNRNSIECNENIKQYKKGHIGGAKCDNCDSIVIIEKDNSKPSRDEYIPKLSAEDYVDKCMKENKTLTEILTQLNELFSLNNSHAAELYKKRLWKKINEDGEKSKEYSVVNIEYEYHPFAYKFTLMNDDAILFRIKVKASPEKFIHYVNNPNILKEVKLILSFSKTDLTSIPIDPIVKGIKMKGDKKS
ncbi:hypothetical protein [Belliella aquatica]|uniref:Uncharacterized protein n=1 Tax=Belliella aquatica TaxID=1323734 RepID=A0ABQ1M6S0_9BACT|nr:hypothetical protein [Belliella aquatica]MCH7404633.1 hypothetical protein [Belliella aquatica]GGC35352.1 hypothetical protein GCM10010993_12830 [Belliella aquatica]